MYYDERPTINPAMFTMFVLVILVFVVWYAFGDGFGDGGFSVSAGTKPQGSKAVARPAITGDDSLFIAPYPGKYVITQGLHGQSYGHLAIDLSAGKGAPVVSPINGQVTQVAIDQYGNTTLVIENSVYRVLMLHGKWTVRVGDVLKAGDQVGTESNIGYTLDFQGRLCYPNRDCGYHVHLNVWSQDGNLLNPLKLIS